MSVGGNVEVKGLSQFTAVNNLFISGTLTTSGSVSLGQSVYDVDSHLVLSSSAGSVVALSSSLDFPTDGQYNIRAVNNRLILSSSDTGGSIVSVSGSINIEPPVAGRGARLGTASGFGITGLFVASENAARNGNIVIDGAVNFANGGGAYDMLVGRGGVGGSVVFGQGIFLSTGGIMKWSGGTLLGGSVAAYTFLGRHDSGSIYISGADGRNELMAKNSHLILSSAAGSVVRISGALGAQDLTTATLPANNVILSGALVWDSTRKALKVYGPEGWTVIATGTVG